MLLKQNFYVLLFITLVYKETSTFNIVDPQLPDVHYVKKEDNKQYIDVDEENPVTGKERKTIALITDVGGQTLQPNENGLLFATQIEDADTSDQKKVTINALDYEQLRIGGLYTGGIDIIPDGDLSQIVTLSITIKNLDDEPPTLVVSNCTMKENDPAAKCPFIIKDLDGFLGKMNFADIDSPLADTFEFTYDSTPDDTSQNSTVNLALKQNLDYETTNLYTFQVRVTDSAGNQANPVASDIVVKVTDQPDQPPVWKQIKNAYTQSEETPFDFIIEAIDGDYGIKDNITYQIEANGLATVDATGKISVIGIDRDTVPSTDTVVIIVTAFEEHDVNSILTENITIYITDIDDNLPKIEPTDPIETTVDEGTDDTGIEFDVTDIDLGPNAMYDIKLTSGNQNVDYTQAFSVVPKKGFERTTVTLSVTDSKKLDFENADWKIINLKVETIGTVNPDRTDSQTISITLLDINDEFPIFDQNPYNVTIKENATKDTIIINIKATDKDAEDSELTHELVGTLAKDILKIDPNGGDVTILKDNAFDYEKQTEMYIQIVATDKADHKTTTQLTIKLTDVNDEKPKISVASGITINENVGAEFVIPTDITATDDDENPSLEFSIDWTKSYVTKNSQKLTNQPDIDNKIIQCDTVPTTDPKKVEAKLYFSKNINNSTPDFEQYDTMYIYLVVTDKNNEVAGQESDFALIGISIMDLNDNTPQFTDPPPDISVNENFNGIVVAIPATDADVNDAITYSIAPLNGAPDWFNIDTKGTITVKENTTIDCDDTKLQTINYDITATDSATHSNSTSICININDLNDEVPSMNSTYYKEIKEENESPNGFQVIQLNPQDKDLTDPNNRVTCDIIETGMPFKVTPDNNIVVSLEENETLDRETQSEYTFGLSCKDKGSPQNPVTPEPKIRIKLIDINDNPPTIANRPITGVNENSNHVISPGIFFEDKDEGINAFINADFTHITKIERYINENDPSPVDGTPQNLLRVAPPNGNLIINDTLKDYWGFLKLTLKFIDSGTDPSPLEGNGIIKVPVAKFNFYAPKFVNFNDGNTIYLRKNQNPNAPLFLYNGVKMDPIKAVDNQKDKFTMLYKIVDDPAKIFNIIADSGELQMTDVTKQEKFTITVQAHYNPDSGADTSLGIAEFATNNTINIDFFDEDDTDPIFQVNEGSCQFSEGPINNKVCHIPTANYSKSDLPDEIKNKVYYLLKNGDPEIFSLNKTTGELTILKELDYETTSTYNLLIQSSNSDKIRDNAVKETQLSLTIGVVDINDNGPIFSVKEYITTLLVTDKTTDKSVVATVSATDVDTTSKDKLCYKVHEWSCYPDSMKNYSSTPFSIDEKLGAVKPGFTPKSDMTGYYNLKIVVQDEGDGDGNCQNTVAEEHKDYSNVTIYLVSNANLVQFNFENAKSVVDAANDKIIKILNTNFNKYSASLQVSTEENSDDGTTRAKLPTYFVDTTKKQPIESDEIYKKCADVTFFRILKDAFKPAGLVLLSFEGQATDTENIEALLKAWLIGVSVVLGALVLILAMAFFLKTRSLNQRINKLSSTKFGSQESGLNRIGTAAPTTNKHAVEGSNPVFNNEIDVKEIGKRDSVISADSDLIGIEDDDKFNYDYPNKEPIPD